LFSENKIKRDHTYPSEHGVCKNKIKQKDMCVCASASTRMILPSKERPAPANSDVFVFEKKNIRMMVLKEIEI